MMGVIQWLMLDTVVSIATCSPSHTRLICIRIGLSFTRGGGIRIGRVGCLLRNPYVLALDPRPRESGGDSAVTACSCQGACILLYTHYTLPRG